MKNVLPAREDSPLRELGDRLDILHRQILNSSPEDERLSTLRTQYRDLVHQYNELSPEAPYTLPEQR